MILVQKLNSASYEIITRILHNRSPLKKRDIMKGYYINQIIFLNVAVEKISGSAEHKSSHIKYIANSNISPALPPAPNIAQWLRAKRRLNNLQKKAWITFYSCQLIL